MGERVSISRFRPELRRWISYVQRPEHYVVLTSHEYPVAALVSVETLKLIWDAQDERRIGPIDPATGHPFGSEWVSRHFAGHYERHRDPEAHLHPSREQAPWLGRPFDWPPPAASNAPPPQPAPPPAAPAPKRRWWPFRRR